MRATKRARSASKRGNDRAQTSRSRSSDGPPPMGPKEFLARFPDIPAVDSKEILELRQLPLVGATRAQLFWQLGVRSLADIAELDESSFRKEKLVLDYPDGSLIDAFPLLQGFAKSITLGKPLVYGPEPMFDELEGPIWYLDLEFIAGTGEVFLWGLKPDGEDKVVQWFEHTRRGQRESLERFCDMVKEEDPLFVAYGSKASDEVSIREAAKRHRMEGPWLKEMRFLDILKRVIFTESPETQRVYLPVRKLKCEHVAMHFGYKKPSHISVRDGYHALKLYQRYRRRQDPGVAERLCAYNAEDLYQTEILFRGLQDLFEREG